MPRSKRARPVTLSAVSKKPPKESAARTAAALHVHLPGAAHVYVLTVRNPRNSHLAALRARLPPGAKLLFGRAKVLAHALGGGSAAEPAPGTAALAPYLRNEGGGPVGLLFVPAECAPEATEQLLMDFRPLEFASAGQTAPRAVALPAGVVYAGGGEVDAAADVPAARTLEPELRRLGVPVRMAEGRMELGAEYVVCQAGEALGSGQAAILRMFGVRLAECRVELQACWAREGGEVRDLRDEEASGGEGGAWSGIDEDGDVTLG